MSVFMFVYVLYYLGQILASESLFTYPPNKTTADYINASFIPAFEPPCYTDADKQTCLNVCDTNKFCYYDCCVTKDTTLAANTKKAIADYSNNLQILSKFYIVEMYCGF